ncbi:succinate dehydrogenase cytochrome b subunit [Leptolyngbya iicbica]|uniref:Succinate dehydrogenase cytochrome b subunit n=2 Tax=Cyanophyceae TaxID=3028117 RepID=A0A4Q7E1V2_9CYAN|nr:succinate dehydrogenase cytochrome b subunit [Leptolyngbya sp. LK]RZM75458.1 succinate dehydrogenase cytochrome b subunit [Leptolyngbya sp. LK]
MENTVRQPALLQLYTSPIGKKLITGVTGVGLVTFVLVHMVGNLLLFAGHDAYNAYAHHLESWGPLLWLVESILVAVFALHAIAGIHIFVSKLNARPDRYATYASKGGPSLQSISSRTMIVTGLVLATFLGLHLWSFKFGTYYTTQLADEPVRDLARLVVEKFHHPLYAFGYSSVMVLLGFHLRHGIWSALQSLGLQSKAIRYTVYGLSLGGAIAIATGFVLLPLTIYFGLLT